MTWPTPHPGPARGDSSDTWGQPTVSGEPASALYGCVRNSGNRFHEGIDVTPYHKRDRRGEATDPVVAAWEGVVTHISTTPGNSGYGRYLVLEHPQFSPAAYTLYAHLASVDGSLATGETVAEGARLGIMGRSAGGYSIPRDRAHLHFEIGVRLSEHFQSWYDRQKFGSQNHHGLFNGMNLVGLDPLDCYNWLRAQPGRTFNDYFRSLPPGMIVDVITSKIPDFARRYPGLLTGPIPEQLAGWRVSITAAGVPIKLEPLRSVEAGANPGDVTVVAVDPEQLGQYACRKMVTLQRDGGAKIGSGGRQLLELLFDFQ